MKYYEIQFYKEHGFILIFKYSVIRELDSEKDAEGYARDAEPNYYAKIIEVDEATYLAYFDQEITNINHA